MFQSARFKLTGWYLLITMIISASFSVVIYEVLTRELNRVEQIQRLRQERLIPEFRQRILRIPAIDPEVIEETKNRLKINLLVINLGILAFSGGAGYFLAGRTLRPIKDMLDEQNRFITDASHELRTPLTSLKSEIEVNLRDKSLKLQNAKKLLESNLEEVNNLQSLSDSLIRLTQYQKNNDNLMENVSLSEIGEEAVKKVSGLAKHKNIKIKNSIKNINLKGERLSLIEVLVILLDNAIKYSPKETTINLSSKSEDKSVVVEVKDQGIGIEEQDIPHVFDRFYRADKSRTKTEVEGFGLGLSIAKQIIEKHHGSMIVESESDKGSVFSIKLPFED